MRELQNQFVVKFRMSYFLGDLETIKAKSKYAPDL